MKSWIDCVAQATTENPESSNLDVLLPRGTYTNGLLIGAAHHVRGRDWMVYDWVVTGGDGVRLLLREVPHP